MQRKLSNMKKYLFLFLCMPFFAVAQEKPLLVEGVSPGLYIKHKVASKENYYSIGRIYNVSPKEIAPFNKLQLESGLSLGQQIKIPLNNNNFFQSGNAEADETFVPVYHIVKAKEGLYRVAVNHNDLPLETLKQWNNINGDAVKNGTRLVVGYLKVKKDLSALAKKGIGTSINANTVVKVEEKNTAEAKPDKKIKKTETGPPVSKTETFPVAKNTESVKQQSSNADKNIVGEVFKIQYETQIKNSRTIDNEGTAGIFKSTSGWADKKYYCLHNSAATGTIIKITNPANGKFVYAKVLDLIPDIKKNEGLLICLSNAAADALAVPEGNFTCLLNYAK